MSSHPYRTKGSKYRSFIEHLLCGRLYSFTHAVYKHLTFGHMGPFQDLLLPFEAGVPSPLEKEAEAWGVFNWSSADSQWVKQILNLAFDSKTDFFLLPHSLCYIMFLYVYMQYKSPVGWLGSAFSWLCCFSCVQGMAFINTERELDFYFVIIHITEVGKVITMEFH